MRNLIRKAEDKVKVTWLGGTLAVVYVLVAVMMISGAVDLALEGNVVGTLVVAGMGVAALMAAGVTWDRAEAGWWKRVEREELRSFDVWLKSEVERLREEGQRKDASEWDSGDDVGVRYH